MKRFAIFGGRLSRIQGGWDDFVETFETRDAAKAHCPSKTLRDGFEWGQIVDLENGLIIDYGMNYQEETGEEFFWDSDEGTELDTKT